MNAILEQRLAVLPELSLRLAEMKRRIRAGEHHRFRTPDTLDFAAECEREGLDWTQRAARFTRRMCEAQTVVIEPDERIVFTRTVPWLPPPYRSEEMDRIPPGAPPTNAAPSTTSALIGAWFWARASRTTRGRRGRPRPELAGDREAEIFLDAAVETIDAVLELARRYAATARAAGPDDVADRWSARPPIPPPVSIEALQALRLCHAVLLLSGHYHCGLGRLDQYLWPYLEADLAEGRLDSGRSRGTAGRVLHLLNKDSDLYPGVQQGDNGQSLMLGGVTPDGRDAVNPLTAMALAAARKVALIDPKINLRVTRDTDLKLLAKGVELTRIGLGFPQ